MRKETMPQNRDRHTAFAQAQTSFWVFFCASLSVLKVADPPAASTATQEEDRFQLFKKGSLTHNSRTAEKQVPERMPEWEAQHKGGPPRLSH